MSGRFISESDVVRDRFDWGEAGWISRPELTGSRAICVMDVTIVPGGGHAFHKHPDQEEVIWVREGRIEQWLERDKRELSPGEAVYIPKGVVLERRRVAVRQGAVEREEPQRLVVGIDLRRRAHPVRGRWFSAATPRAPPRTRR